MINDSHQDDSTRTTPLGTPAVWYWQERGVILPGCADEVARWIAANNGGTDETTNP